MFSKHLKDIVDNLNNFLHDEYPNLKFEIEESEFNSFDSLVLSFNESNDVMLFVDSEEGIIDVSIYDSYKMKDHNYINGYGVENINNIINIIKSDIENISNQIDSIKFDR